MSELLTIQLEETKGSDAEKDKSKTDHRPSMFRDKNGRRCRSCTAFREFFGAHINQGERQALQDTIPDDCPADVEVLGRSTWTFLHTLASKYPDRPSDTDKADMASFIRIFGKFYPCWHCADDFRDWMRSPGHGPRLDSRTHFERWMCEAHNQVNVKLGKSTFDCSPKSLDERWGQGPDDGRCG